MIKILYIIDSLGPAGKERQLVETLKGLDRRSEFEVCLVLLNNYIHYEEIKKLKCDIIIIKRRWKKDPLIFIKLFEICRDFKPDIIHSWERMCSIYALPIAKLIKAKFVNGTIRNTTTNIKKYRKQWWLDKITFILSDKIVGNTATGLKNYKVPPAKGYFVYNGFDFKRIKKLQEPDKIREKFNIKTPLVVGMVARFDHRKDYETFVRCGIELVKKRNDVTFIAVGDDKKVSRNGVISIDHFRKIVPDQFKNRIIFTGPQKEIESIINIFTIGVLLTNYEKHGEGISNSIIEYLALKKPVIATDAGGTPEIIQNEENGYLIPENDPQKIMEKIEELLENPNIRNKMGDSGQQLIRSKFNIDIMTENFVKLYKQLVK